MFQGHPEMTGPIHQAILDTGFAAQLADPSEEGQRKKAEEVAQPHSGETAWRRAMVWATQN